MAVGSELPAYDYKSLRKPKEEIRLVKILKGKPYDPIEVDISQWSLNDAKCKYTALSYACGDQNNKVSIHVCEVDATTEAEIGSHAKETKARDHTSKKTTKGKHASKSKTPKTHLLVTRNLSMALRYLRDESEDLLFWIDAICIHQTDEREKESQVFMMTEIYKRAAEVKIWLGPAEGDSDEAMEKLRDGNNINISFEGEGLRLRRALDAILLRAYWTRAWVVQEIMVNKNLKIRCGKKEVEWESGVNALKKYSNLLEKKLREEKGEKKKRTRATNTAQNLNTRPHTTISDLDDHRRRYLKEGGKQVKLLEILRTTRPFDATDSRDKIFSLLGLNLSGLRESADFKPAYKLSLVDVSIQLFKHCVHDFQKEGPLDIICENQPDNKSDFPTWLPNFAADNGMERWSCQKELRDIGRSEAEPKYSPDKRTLSVRAVRVAEIHKTTDSRDNCLATDD
ncbi:hypothetical protein BFW01_g8099 [Lasiodiplodia theobromae]|nr:hypothetical protein BFW01_g8099 [Lasiodiplodia theobromae]